MDDVIIIVFQIGGIFLSDKEREMVLSHLEEMGLDSEFLIRETFLGYKWRRERKKLYGADIDLPTKLIRMYYELNPDEIVFDRFKRAFVKRYIRNESKLEDVHIDSEIKGLEKMYEYVHSDDIEYRFDVYTLLDLHRMLFSFSPFPEYAGSIRNDDVYLPGTGTELCEWREIRHRLNEIDEDVQYLRSIAEEVKDSNDADQLLAYLDCCVEINCRLVKVHPFFDGNGRTIRAFTNKLLEDVGLPPIYILERERGEYHKAMNEANNDGDFTDIKNFYRYKICDSIIELDINERVKKMNPTVRRYKAKEKVDDLNRKKDC